jgi:hypothetical protein
MNFREMGVAEARNTIKGMVDRYGDRVRRFASVDNIIPKSYVTDLLPGLEIPEKISLFYEVKADLSLDQIKTLAKARVVEVQPGVASSPTVGSFSCPLRPV